MDIDKPYMVTKAIRMIRLGVAFILAIFTLTSCANDMNMILEVKDIQFFKIQQTNDSPVTIKMSGLIFHSSLAIKDITTSQVGKSLQVLVHLTPVTGNLSGNLDYTLIVPATINKVIFGNDKVMIWERSMKLEKQ